MDSCVNAVRWNLVHGPFAPLASLEGGRTVGQSDRQTADPLPSISLTASSCCCCYCLAPFPLHVLILLSPFFTPDEPLEYGPYASHALPCPVLSCPSHACKTTSSFTFHHPPTPSSAVQPLICKCLDRVGLMQPADLAWAFCLVQRAQPVQTVQSAAVTVSYRLKEILLVWTPNIKGPSSGTNTSGSLLLSSHSRHDPGMRHVRPLRCRSRAEKTKSP